MQALVTGGTGFIGSHVVELLLDHGHSVRLFSRRAELPARLANDDVSLFPGDLQDPDTLLNAMNGMDVFYHIGEIRNISSRAARQNVRLLERVIGNLTQSGLKRIVFISSLGVAGIPSSVPASEDTAPKVLLQDHYTRYKQQCETLLAEKIPATEHVVIRPGVVYGPGSRYFNGLISAIDRFGPVGIPFAGKGGNVAPLIYVKDLAAAVYLSGIAREAAGQVFNLTDGLRNSWADFFNAIAAALNKKMRIRSFPPVLLRVPARSLDIFTTIFGVRLSLNAYVQYITADLLYDNGKARRLLHWKPEHTLIQGVEEMVRVYRAR
jgi:nucleoside-diphosphate-sugar epimerase